MARFSRLFLGPGLPYITAGDLRPAGDPTPAIDYFKNYVGDVWFGFGHNFLEKISPGP